ncbi:MAG: ABC transporter permease/M1 family aminopeptidase [Allosphingosinicella sp.]|uniref:ABC transporter permease/M1 family aminopeptidase n=1 Tax=Allosphingosinicella sp. TaxID=2823234 RepID=UPI003962D18C
MLRHIAAFEFRYQLKNPVFWVTAAIFFLLTFGAMTVDQIQMGGGGNVLDNSPYATAEKHLILSLFFMFVTTAFVANVIVRDDETGFGPIVRSTRITKADYLFGRFAGAIGVALLAFLAVPLAIWLGSLMPWLDPETLGPNRLRDYAFAYFALALPNIIVTGAIFFALATATRSMMGTYLAVIGFIVVYTAVNVSLADQPQLEQTRALVDPFGIAAWELETRYWTAAERNQDVPSFAGLLLWNRLIWGAVAAAFLGLAFFLYRFADRGLSRGKRRRQKLLDAAASQATPVTAGPLPSPRFGRAAARAQLAARTRLEMGQVFRSPAFLVLIVLGLLNAGTALWTGGDLYGMPTYPVTRALIPLLAGSFIIIPLIIAIYYAGELVWRERDRKMHEIVDATPLPNWAYVVPKTIAVSLVLLTTVMISVVAAILVQLLKGHSELELGKYFLWYILPFTFDMVLFAVLAVFVQALSPNKYIGWGVMVLYLIARMVLGTIGFQHNLYLYAGVPAVPLSDMNGAGIYWEAAWWFRLYWGAFALLLLVAAHLLWRRGTETRLKPRLARAPARLKGQPGLIAGAAALVFAASGGWIFYNTNILNDYCTTGDNERFQAEYEKRYLPFENLPQPTISHVEMNVALYPSDIRAETRGRLRLVNLNPVPVEEVHVRAGDRAMELTALDFPGARLTRHDEEYGYRIYRLDAPMRPGETRELRFATLREQRGFRNSGADTRLVPNGTFLNNFELAPQIGMNRFQLLQERSTRRKYGLPPELRPAKLEDMSATARSYFGGGWSTADITVSTEADQVPIAPGRKVVERVDGGRRTARFVSDAPILTFFSIQSARYAVERRRHDGIDLAVYYHPTHHWNVGRMLDAMQASFDYFQPAFGPYQFEQARIIEFPAYATFAQAFANTMPYSEAIGFVADARDTDEIDYVTYVTAHEVAHQWWAHQVIGADMQGASMLSETLAQYSALMVMKRLYGEDKIRRFLRYELDKYLRSRGTEAIEELPLARVENQGYIHYQKGTLVMYLLQERLGEEAVNRVLSRLIARYRFSGAPYPRSLDLIALLREEARTPEQQALITDLFERITIYDLKVEAPTAVQRPDGRWDVSVPVVAAKYYADGRGRETEANFAEAIEIGLFTAEPGRGAFDRSNVVALERRPLRPGRQVVRFVADRRPSHAGVDPYNYYIDRNSGDNVAPVG